MPKIFKNIQFILAILLCVVLFWVWSHWNDPAELTEMNQPCPQAGWEQPPKSLLEHIRTLGPPDYVSIHPITVRAADIEAARSGQFRIGGREADLSLPVDWLQDPYRDRSWRFWLHSLVILEPLLQGYEQTGDARLLGQALDITLDWLGRNQRGTEGISNFAWYDMAVPARAAYMAYLLRAAAVEGILTPGQAGILGRNIEDHADWLTLQDNYKPGHNHGLFQDVGLFVTALQFPDHPKARCWADIARERFAETVAATVEAAEGMHLEHSPGYHVGITKLLERFQTLGIGGPQLAALVEKMRDSAGWLVMPDNRYPQLGDTDLNEVPHWVQEKADRLWGLKLFPRSGYGIVKLPESYLILAAAYHGRGHKHADELHLSFYEQGRRILVDAGRYGYYYDEPGRQYAESSRAHNGVEFAGEEFVWRGTKPYGSALLGGGQQDGWYYLAAKNPLVEQQQINHSRLVLYRPGEQLLVVDKVLLPKPLLTSRYFHFAPGLELEAEGQRSLVIQGEGFQGQICNPGAREQVAIRRVAGVLEPQVQGFTFPANRDWQVAPTAILETTVSDVLLVTAIDLDPVEGICAGSRRLTLEWNGQRLSVGDGEEWPPSSTPIIIETAAVP